MISQQYDRSIMAENDLSNSFLNSIISLALP
jgi:hypothetical protein